MKKAILISFAVMAVSSVTAQQSGQTAPAGQVPPAPQAPPAGQAPAAQPGRVSPSGVPLSPAQQNPNQVQQPQPGLAARTNQFGVVPTNQVFFSPTNDFAIATNQFIFGTNQFSVATNRFGIVTNRFGIRPSFVATNPLTPTGAGTNRVFATNRFAATNFALTNASGVLLQDQAFTQTDRLLLVQIRQTVQTQIRTIAGAPLVAGRWSPVHFVVRESTVTLIGFVTTIEERQRLISTVQGVPGVAQVIDNLEIRTLDQALSPADQALVMQIRQILDPFTSTARTPPMRVVARDGTVTLVGAVTSPELRQQIQTVVAQVPGVVQVHNQLSVNPNPETPFTPEGIVGTNRVGLITNQPRTTVPILTPTGRPLQTNAINPPGSP